MNKLLRNKLIKAFTILFILQSFILMNDYSEIDNAFKFSVSKDRKVYYAGENLYLNFMVTIDKGYHIYSSHPDGSLSPTSVEISDSTYFSQIGILNEPIPNKKYDENFNQDVYYHQGSLTFRQDLKLSENLQEGIYNIEGTLLSYVCDIEKCIPRWDEFNFSFEVLEGSKRIEYTNNLEEFKNIIDNSKSNELDDEINKGLFSFIVFAFGMGFLALLTPCVFPMIPITVSYFTKEGEKGNSNPLYSASLYAIGIITIFTSLGLILSFTIGASGAGDLAANPWINIFIGLLFIYLAFSLFGYYEIQIPSILRKFSLNQEGRGGKIGILFMSLTFTLTSFTCTVAFVGALLATASQGEYFWPIVGMLSFSCAFAFPFFFLALFPQYLSKLPQSGGWLNSIKVVMGFLELAAAFKFISNADLVWNWGIFDRFSVLLIWSLLFLLISIYLLGYLKMPLDSSTNRLGINRILISFFFLFIAGYLTTGLMNGRKIHGLIESYLPPPTEEHWIDNLEDAFIVSQKENKPIFIDFTGYTCTNCRWMEINIFEEPDVQELFSKFILTKLYTDGREDLHKKNRELEINRFGTAALPFYVILSPDDQVLATFPGMDTNKQNFIDFLNNAYEKISK